MPLQYSWTPWWGSWQRSSFPNSTRFLGCTEHKCGVRQAKLESQDLAFDVQTARRQVQLPRRHYWSAQDLHKLSVWGFRSWEWSSECRVNSSRSLLSSRLNAQGCSPAILAWGSFTLSPCGTFCLEKITFLGHHQNQKSRQSSIWRGTSRSFHVLIFA